MAHNYLQMGVQKMTPKLLPVQSCVWCAERRAGFRAVVYADPHAERFAVSRAVIRADQCVVKNCADSENFAETRAVTTAQSTVDDVNNDSVELYLYQNDTTISPRKKIGTDAERHAVLRAELCAELRAVVRADLFAVKWHKGTK